MLNYTIRVADSLQMGVDLTLGTGWPWGGKNVSLVDAAKRIFVRKLQLKREVPFFPRELKSPFETGTLIYPDQLDIRVFDSKKDRPSRKWGFAKLVQFGRNSLGFLLLKSKKQFYRSDYQSN